MNVAAIKAGGERIEKVGAVKGEIRRTETRASLVAIVEFQELAGLHVAGVDAGRRGADGGDLVGKPDRLQRLDGLRADIDRGADLAERRSLLEHLRLQSEGFERLCRRQSGQATADNRDPAA